MIAVQVTAAVFDGLAGEDRMVLSYVPRRPVRFDPRGVAEVVGLTPAAVALAVGRLAQVGLLAGTGPRATSCRPGPRWPSLSAGGGSGS